MLAHIAIWLIHEWSQGIDEFWSPKIACESSWYTVVPRTYLVLILKPFTISLCLYVNLLRRYYIDENDFTGSIKYVIDEENLGRGNLRFILNHPEDFNVCPSGRHRATVNCKFVLSVIVNALVERLSCNVH